MPNHRSRGASAVVGTMLLLALVTAGCGRGGLPPAAGAGSGPDEGLAGPSATATGPTSSPPVETAAPSSTPATSPPGATEPPGLAPEVTPAPLAPIVPPHLTAIEALLADLDAALGADATADTDEGSTP
ncbi:MAG: hypothetical protein L0227_06555 [Chloroflexi bacterium]|nr:hypothetical protein [Chloroflexota bacterium]